jgi:hypothetical protein
MQTVPGTWERISTPTRGCSCTEKVQDAAYMKRLAVALSTAVMLLASCEKTPSKLEGQVKGVAEAGGENLAQVEGLVQGIEARLKALEGAHGKGAHSVGGPGDPSVAERLQKVEANLVRREEALAFLEMAYAQQKRQEDMKSAQEHDPNAVFAVDISGAVAAGQVEGPNSAIITIVEAWDFA